MDMNEYQRRARETATYPRGDLINTNAVGEERPLPLTLGSVYCALKMVGEAGEYSEKVGKMLRGDPDLVSNPEAARKSRMLELGDVLWYIANAAEEEGYTLTEIAEGNLAKLAARKEAGTLKGSGDNR